MKKFILILIAIGLFVFGYHLFNDDEVSEPEPQPEVQINAIASGLYVPWEVAFLPEGEFLITQRNGLLKMIGTTTQEFRVPSATERGEGGLLGMALHPNYLSNQFIYLYYTTSSQGRIINRVIRFKFDKVSLIENKVIIDNIPGDSVHNGGRIAFGPDGYLYITTGDAGNDDDAQDTNSLAGKILRVTDDGSIPEDNPFENAVYSYGHRNPQGLAWDSYGDLWATEHGRSGLQSGYDEINLIEKGANYGWPVIEGDGTRDKMKSPILHSGSSTTWAPAGMAFSNGKLYFAGLRGESLYEVPIVARGVLGELKTNFEKDYGRLRAVIKSGSSIFFSTSNRDGRGSVRQGDDKVFKLN